LETNKRNLADSEKLFNVLHVKTVNAQ